MRYSTNLYAKRPEWQRQPTTRKLEIHAIFRRLLGRDPSPQEFTPLFYSHDPMSVIHGKIARSHEAHLFNEQKLTAHHNKNGLKPAPTAGTVAIVSHAFHSTDGLSKVAGYLTDSFRNEGWHASSHLCCGIGPHWWKRIPQSTSLVVLATPIIVVPPFPRGYFHRVVAYTMFEEGKIPPAWIERLNSCVDAVYVPLPFIREAMVRSGLQPPVHVAGFGWDSGSATPRPPPRRNFGAIAVAGPRKNLEQTIEAFHEVHQADPNTQLFIHARHVEPETNPRLTKLVRTTPGVILSRGSKTESEMNRWWSQIDCYVLMSNVEGLSLTPREAIRRGIPCVVGAIEAHQDIISTGWAAAVPVRHYSDPYGTFAQYQTSEIAAVMTAMIHRDVHARAQAVPWKDVTCRIQ
jgi:glycosyltransferase involved in cell wall biosynthesis